jgi:AcrR family transcriptional regulator
MGTPATKPAQLHPGRHGLDRAFVIQNQRDRILNAIAEEVARKGYVETTVADVVSRAGVSSRTFYDFFRDKAECFLAAYDAAIETLLRHVSARV